MKNIWASFQSFVTDKKRLPFLIAVTTAVILLSFLIFILIELWPDTVERETDLVWKPVIYLYPTEEITVDVRLEYNGELTFTYPKYKDGWQVIAFPDGKLISDGKEYSYLFWEGESAIDYDFSKGFVVKGEDTASFLQEKLSYMGLMPKEYNEFIVFWLPMMQNNAYNLITFQDDAYTDSAVLHITPRPDSILRVFMAYQPLEKPIDIDEPTLPTFEREGFVVVEWGGTCVESQK